MFATRVADSSKKKMSAAHTAGQNRTPAQLAMRRTWPAGSGHVAMRGPRWGLRSAPVHHGVRQGNVDGHAQDGDDSYPRQAGGAAPQQDAPAPAGGATPAGTYATPPDVPTILADTVMAAQLQRAWTDSNPNAPDVPSGSPGSLKREQGGWFLWRRDSHILQNIRVGPGSRDGLPTIVGTRPPDSDIQQVVAWFHTHPNKDSEGYASGPGAGDINWQNAEAKVPGIIMTHAGTVTIPFP